MDLALPPAWGPGRPAFGTFLSVLSALSALSDLSLVRVVGLVVVDLLAIV